MREFKFRVWDIQEKEMINWNYLKKETSEFQLGDFNDPKYFKFMQWTGLKDKNGKDIYEGDIVKTNLGNKAKIGFKWGCFFLITRCKVAGKRKEFFDNYWWELKHFWKVDGDIVDLEVIGNIWEDKHLLD